MEYSPWGRTKPLLPPYAQGPRASSGQWQRLNGKETEMLFPKDGPPHARPAIRTPPSPEESPEERKEDTPSPVSACAQLLPSRGWRHDKNPLLPRAEPQEGTWPHPLPPPSQVASPGFSTLGAWGCQSSHKHGEKYL